MNMRVDITAITRWLYTPHGILIATFLLSFAAWAFPSLGFLQKGYEPVPGLFLRGIPMVLLWTGLVALSSFAGYTFGRRLQLSSAKTDAAFPLTDQTIYYIFSAVSFVGVAYLLLYLHQLLSFSGMLEVIQGGEANRLKEALYEDYSIGLLSLRYMVILSGGIALFRVITGLSRTFLEIINILMLLLVALVSSRLSLIFSFMVAVGFWAGGRRRIILNPLKIAALLALLFLILAGYNASRNINSYTDRGSASFLDAGLSEMLTYLGTPFEGALATGAFFDRVCRGEDPETLGDIDPGLTTNSAFANLTVRSGSFSFLLGPVVGLLASFVMGTLSRQNRNYLFLPYLVLLYCFAEVWRTVLFDTGIITELLVMSILIPLIGLLVRALALRPGNRSPVASPRSVS